MLTGPKVFLAVAGAPVTAMVGRAVAMAAGTIAYQCPATVGTVSVLAVVDATTVVLVPPSTTTVDCPDQGFRTMIDPVEPASTIAIATFPFCTCTSTFDLPWM